jgi:hypothetical protein
LDWNRPANPARAAGHIKWPPKIIPQYWNYILDNFRPMANMSAALFMRKQRYIPARQGRDAIPRVPSRVHDSERESAGKMSR